MLPRLPRRPVLAPAGAGGAPAGPQVLALGTVVVAVALVGDGTYTLVAGRLSRRLRTPEAQGRLSGTSGVDYLGLAGLALAG